jgi:hypothetical protein
MSIEEIRALKHAKPFRPFALVTKGGERVFIRDSLRIALSPTGRSVAGYGQDGSFFLMVSDIASARPVTIRKRNTK